MNEVLEKLSAIGIVPVIKIDDVEKAVPLAKALVAGGIPCAEVTFRTEQAEEAIRRMAQEVPEMIVGAGTVLTPEQADRAIAAGSKFLVSPGLNPKVVKHCIDKGYLITPGTSNPSDVEVAIELGLDVVKFFPAEAAGGIKMIKSMAAPYTKMKFMPTGGINANNLNDYLSFNKIICCGGSWMVKEDLINAGEFDKITELCREAMAAMLGFEVAHVGINTADENAAKELAAKFNKLFNFPIKDGNSAVFASSGIEVRKQMFRGKNGHIAIKTNYIDRAVRYIEFMGGVIDEQDKTIKNGKLTACYLKGDFGGFDLHLVQK
ncbi:MAG: bifunctional 4-hydroxy-2-oxoglutarate aldolase/2-dehydro-3-deoxy-phosphogluconate aldolase [Firmicutes bacterium]|nr:bifunctional 4-hydroxy-2-oxoglutarate aldolase/2-dehydro-3-deoxy-phosphogluconate aldolase [Bacillota bacterium]